MKKVAVLMLCLAASGCAGLKKHSEDTFWPFGDPNAPKSESENFRRVRGEYVAEQPLVAQQGDVWPGQPDAVPTVKDMNNPNSRFSRSFQRSIKGLNSDLDQQQLANGETLALGENVATEKGVQRRSSASEPGSLPSHVPDRAKNYLEGPNRKSVAIPNGDGTTTLVGPDGTVRVVRGDPTVAMQQPSQHSAVPSKKHADTSHHKKRHKHSDASSKKKREHHKHSAHKKHHHKLLGT